MSENIPHSLGGFRGAFESEHGLDECDPNGFAHAILAAARSQPMREPLTTGKYSDLVSDGGMDPRNSAHGITQGGKV